MSDLRNFYGSNNSDIEIVEPASRVEPSIYTPPVYENDIDERPASLGEFHTVEVEETSNTGRIVGSLAIALMLGAAAVYGYEVSNNSHAKPVATQMAANNPAPAPVAAPMPTQSADASQPAPAAAPDTQATPAAPAAMAPAAAPSVAPVKKAPVMRSAARAASSADTSAQAAASAPAVSSGVPEQSAAVQPIYPTAPSSALATNNNQPIITPQAAEPTPDAAPAQAAQPAPDQAAIPAPDQSQVQPTAPVPAQSGQPVQ